MNRRFTGGFRVTGMYSVFEGDYSEAGVVELWVNQMVMEVEDETGFLWGF